MVTGSRFRAYAAVVLFLTLVSTAVAKYSGGNGTALDPYRIATAADLIALGETPADYDKHFILTADIDLDPNLPGRKVFDRAVIAPPASLDQWGNFQGKPFTGVFDGNDHTISHLTITGKDYLGLFGQLGPHVGLSVRPTPSTQVRDLGMVAVNITGSGGRVGGLTGQNMGGLVTRCYATGAVAGGESVGGLVGSNAGEVVMCLANPKVTGTARVGGLVGYNGVFRLLTAFSWVARIANCCAGGTVAGGQAVGGLVGMNGFRPEMVGEVGAPIPDVGFVVNCYSTSTVVGMTGTGGLVGKNPDGEVVASFWDVQTSRQQHSAGGTGMMTKEMQDIQTYRREGWDFPGREDGLHEIWQMPEGGGYPVLAVFSGCARPKLEGSGTAGDPYLIHNASELGAMVYYSPSAHYRLTASIDLCGIRWVVAVIPLFEGTFEGNHQRISNLTIEGRRDLGLFGELTSGARITGLGVVDVNVTATAGGAGALLRSNRGTVAECYSTGSVRGTADVGGLVSENGGSIATSYSAASVSGKSPVGGLVGFNDGTVTQCYSSGAVIGTGQYVGGLVGFGPVGVAASFWDIQTSGQSTSAGGTGKTTAEMQTAKTFLDAGWDFVGETKNGTADIWWILEGKDYPRLWWEQGGRGSGVAPSHFTFRPAAPFPLECAM